MMRKANAETDFTVEVEGVGAFTYGRRTIGDSLKIRARYLELVAGHGDDIEMAATASAVATHEVLCVACPDGWSDLLKVDSTNPDAVSKVFELSAAVGEKEDSFRGATQVAKS